MNSADDESLIEFIFKMGNYIVLHFAEFVRINGREIILAAYKYFDYTPHHLTPDDLIECFEEVNIINVGECYYIMISLKSCKNIKIVN